MLLGIAGICREASGCSLGVLVFTTGRKVSSGNRFFGRENY